jgi:hypothetical protein
MFNKLSISYAGVYAPQGEGSCLITAVEQDNQELVDYFMEVATDKLLMATRYVSFIQAILII